jgi:DNA-binding LacI/PurR family transcriptional regulator
MPFCELTGPRLTTVRVFKQEIGGIAVRRLMEKIAGDPWCCRSRSAPSWSCATACAVVDPGTFR